MVILTTIFLSNKQEISLKKKHPSPQKQPQAVVVTPQA
jgi:hypothetical protein